MNAVPAPLCPGRWRSWFLGKALVSCGASGGSRSYQQQRGGGGSNGQVALVAPAPHDGHCLLSTAVASSAFRSTDVFWPCPSRNGWVAIFRTLSGQASGASIGQVWTRHLAPAAPASRPSSPSQFHGCLCHADSALQFVPSLVPGWGKSRAASTGFRALSPSD